MGLFFLSGLCRPFKTFSDFGISPPWSRTGIMFCVTDSIFFFLFESQVATFQGALTVSPPLLLFCPPSPERFNRFTITLTLSPGLSNRACQSDALRLLVIQLAQDLFFSLYPSVHLIVPPPSSAPKPGNVNRSSTWGAFTMSVFLLLFHADDFKSELREQLPLIAGSAAAAVVFIVSLVAISIICSRWVQKNECMCKIIRVAQKKRFEWCKCLNINIHTSKQLMSTIPPLWIQLVELLLWAGDLGFIELCLVLSLLVFLASLSWDESVERFNETRNHDLWLRKVTWFFKLLVQDSHITDALMSELRRKKIMFITWVLLLLLLLLFHSCTHWNAILWKCPWNMCVHTMMGLCHLSVNFQQQVDFYSFQPKEVFPMQPQPLIPSNQWDWGENYNASFKNGIIRVHRKRNTPAPPLPLT